MDCYRGSVASAVTSQDCTRTPVMINGSYYVRLWYVRLTVRLEHCFLSFLFSFLYMGIFCWSSCLVKVVATTSSDTFGSVAKFTKIFMSLYIEMEPMFYFIAGFISAFSAMPTVTDLSLLYYSVQREHLLWRTKVSNEEKSRVQATLKSELGYKWSRICSQGILYLIW